MDKLKEISKEGEGSPSSKRIDALDSEVWMVVLRACELIRQLQHGFLVLAASVAAGAANTPTHESQLRFVKSATETVALFSRDMHRVLGYNPKEDEENEGSVKVEPMDMKTLDMSLMPPPLLSVQSEMKSNDVLAEPHCPGDQNFKKRPLMSTTCSKGVSSSTITNGNGDSNGSNNEEERNPKKKKVLTKKFVRVKSNNPDQANEPPVEDGYVWRKYGQKKIQNALYPRSYYRCSHKHDMGCEAMKQVQRSDEDPSYFVVAYKGEHSCYGETMWPSSLYPLLLPHLMALKYYLPTIPSPSIFHGNNSTDKRDVSSSSTTTTIATSLNVKVEALPPSKSNDVRVESKLGSSSGLDHVIQAPHPDNHKKILGLNRDPLIPTPDISKHQLVERKSDDGEIDKKTSNKEMPLLPPSVVDQDWIMSSTMSSEGGEILMDGIGEFFSPASSEVASGYSYTTVGNLLRLDEATKNTNKDHHGCGIGIQEKYEEVMSHYMAPYSTYDFKDLISGFSDNVEDFFPNTNSN